MSRGTEQFNENDLSTSSSKTVPNDLEDKWNRFEILVSLFIDALPKKYLKGKNLKSNISYKKFINLFLHEESMDPYPYKIFTYFLSILEDSERELFCPSIKINKKIRQMLKPIISNPHQDLRSITSELINNWVQDEQTKAFIKKGIYFPINFIQKPKIFLIWQLIDKQYEDSIEIDNITQYEDSIEIDNITYSLKSGWYPPEFWVENHNNRIIKIPVNGVASYLEKFPPQACALFYEEEECINNSQNNSSLASDNSVIISPLYSQYFNDQEDRITQAIPSHFRNGIVFADPRGLPNFGNTCYMNSILQCLINIPEFVSCLKQSCSEAPSMHSLESTLLEIAERHERNYYLRTALEQFRTAIGIHLPEFLNYSPNDVRYFYMKLISSMKQICEEFKIKIQVTWKCDYCARENRIEDTILFISIDRNHCDQENGLKNYINHYFDASQDVISCECQLSTSIKLSIPAVINPNILVVHLSQSNMEHNRNCRCLEELMFFGDIYSLRSVCKTTAIHAMAIAKTDNNQLLEFNDHNVENCIKWPDRDVVLLFYTKNIRYEQF